MGFVPIPYRPQINLSFFLHFTPNTGYNTHMSLTTVLANVTTNVSTLRTLLSAGHTVHVSFTKKDGTEREAHLTRNMTRIPQNMHPKNVRKTDPKYIFAFDVEKQDWICFHESQFNSLSPFLNMSMG